MYQAIDRFKKEKLITEKIADGLKTLDPRTPRLYITPKIHKPGNPGRPVVSSVKCHAANISKYNDYHLQPVVKPIPSYIKVTNDFINKINDIGNVPPNSYLVTMDIKSFYTKILNSVGIAAVKNVYNNYPKKSIVTKVITAFLALISTLNNSIFNCKHYLQIKRCPMGTICAAAYTNIFMASFKSKFIYP